MHAAFTLQGGEMNQHGHMDFSFLFWILGAFGALCTAGGVVMMYLAWVALR